jgi:hypothetical protein
VPCSADLDCFWILDAEFLQNKGIFALIDLIQHSDDRMVECVELLENLVRGFCLLLGIRAARIDEMKQNIGMHSLLERALESRNECVGILRMNPTVSTSRISCLLGRMNFRVVVSSVAKAYLRRGPLLL